MTARMIPVVSVLLCATLVAGCGRGGAAASAQSAPASRPAQPTASGGSTTTLVGIATDDDMRAYMTALRPMWREVRKANALAHTQVELAPSGKFPAMADLSLRINRHLAKAAALARSVSPPSLLARPHASLVRALRVGARMATVLAGLYHHMGPDSKQQYNQRVLPLERRSVRFGNAWYVPTYHDMRAAHVRMPGWVDRLFDWS